MNASLTLPMAAADLVPHWPPMLLVERLVVSEGDDGTAETCFQEDSLFVGEEGHVEPVALLEAMAQTYAAKKGFDDLAKGAIVSEGYLVGVSQFELLSPVSPETQLRIDVRTTADLEAFFIAEGEIIFEGELVARATMKFWLPESTDESGND